jgi:hypothetical protein
MKQQGGAGTVPANNITNQEAATSVSTEPGLPHNRAEFVRRPRTVGVELYYSFKDH